MQFRSGSFWLNCLSNSSHIRRTIFFTSVFMVALACSARATMTVTSVNSTGDRLSNVIATNNIAYYPAAPFADDPTMPPAYFRDTSDSTIPFPINVNTGQSMVSTFNRDELVYFAITSDRKGVVPPSGGYVVLFATAQGSNGEKPIPIAFVGNGVGNGGLCPTVSGCLSQNTNSNNGFTYYFSYQYKPGITAILGFFPSDICLNYAHFYGGTARGCGGADGTTVSVNESNTTNSMRLNFYVSTLSNTGQNGGGIALSNMLTSPAPVDRALTSVGMVFEKIYVMPSLNCPSLVDVYQPGDSEIRVDTSRFSKTISDLVAPVTHLIVMANEGSAPTVTPSYSEANSVGARVPVGGEQLVSGFSNTTDGADHQYSLSFMVRDAAGIVVSGAGACAMPGPVQTSQIQGFLAKSNCFIATAAYRSTDAGPVMMLRQFRDRVLMKFGVGRGFVRWYYHWSPSAATWLMEHPAFRYPVLVALIPIELIAWGTLHPLEAGVILILFMILKIKWLMSYSSRRVLE